MRKAIIFIALSLLVSCRAFNSRKSTSRFIETIDSVMERTKTITTKLDTIIPPQSDSASVLILPFLPQDTATRRFVFNTITIEAKPTKNGAVKTRVYSNPKPIPVKIDKVEMVTEKTAISKRHDTNTTTKQRQSKSIAFYIVLWLLIACILLILYLLRNGNPSTQK